MPWPSHRHAASEALAAASRFSGVSACSSEVENSIQRMRGQAEGREWQLVEVLLFGLSCCAEGAWGGGAPTCPPAEALRRVEAIGDAVSRVLPGAPSGARRLASLWHVRWLSATAEPMLRAGGPLEPHQALDLALRCLQVTPTPISMPLLCSCPSLPLYFLSAFLPFFLSSLPPILIFAHPICTPEDTIPRFPCSSSLVSIPCVPHSDCLNTPPSGHQPSQHCTRCPPSISKIASPEDLEGSPCLQRLSHSLIPRPAVFKLIIPLCHTCRHRLLF